MLDLATTLAIIAASVTIIGALGIIVAMSRTPEHRSRRPPSQHLDPRRR